MAAAASRKRFSWEEAVVQDHNLQRIDAFVKVAVSKLSIQSSPPANAGRGGSRYQPAPPPTPIVKAEQRPIMANATALASNGSTPQFIDPRDYQSESSSEIDTREVNPMDELSDFESEMAQPQVEQEQSMDVVMEEEEEKEQEQEQEQDEEQDEELDEELEKQTVCEVCEKSDRENELILCDDCDAEFHIFCLDPPLPEVPEGTWFCPKCVVKYPAATVVIKDEQTQRAADDENVATKSIAAVDSESATTEETADRGETPSIDVASIPITQALTGDPEKSNSLLIHACNCDQVKCTDPEFDVFCPHMKRFLRSVCWASHNDKWRSYRLARITAELFAYHAMNCQRSQCNVPLCVKIREEEIV